MPRLTKQQKQAEQSRTRAAQRSREHFASVADIGKIPPVKDPARRESCRLDLFRFLTTYFPASTGKSPFSEDHRRVISRTQDCCLGGGAFANAVYRGFAKTTISENSAIWSILYGHRRFVPVFGSDAGAAEAIIDSIKLELAENDLIYEDFPEVCHAIRALEGKPQRCASQTHQGKLTHIEWTAETIVMPTIPGSVASGGILTARGLTGASRGLKHKRPDGTQQRPDFVIIDDPQTDESASTALQVSKRLDVIRKSILKLGGHDRRIAVVMNATVIRPDDLVEQILDPKRFPAWQGERIKMVKRWSDAHDTLWLTEYQRIRTTYDGQLIGDQRRAWTDATEFYKRNRAQMDANCFVSWEHCFDRDSEISAIQHAYNLLIDDGPEVFASECQNEPARPEENADEAITPKLIASKLNNRECGEVPQGCSRVVAFVDIQKEALFWVCMAFQDDFTGYVIDYGCYPEQPRKWFTVRDIRRTLANAEKVKGMEASVYAGLNTLTGQLAAREFMREDGAAIRLERCLIDANWGPSTDVVYNFCRESAHANILMPSHGRGVTASSIPLSHRKKQPGDRDGQYWFIPAARGRRAVRYAVFDTNHWKTFLAGRWRVPLGAPGCFSIFGELADEHRMFADHVCAELGVQTEGRGRRLIEWKLRPGAENHWLDGVVGCCVAASIQGCRLGEHGTSAGPPRQRIKLSDLQKAKRRA